MTISRSSLEYLLAVFRRGAHEAHPPEVFILQFRSLRDARKYRGRRGSPSRLDHLTASVREVRVLSFDALI